ncbi:MAG: NAD-dependent epimerase/dehydratase family protein [Cyanothece sp. SIO1E1]|nr:NAD-dependent epimerase/dehydratase family protein [Cyanothece sp. SIO1E1]
MVKRVLILGGKGRIGRSVATDLATHTQAEITITGRRSSSEAAVDQSADGSIRFLRLDLADQTRVVKAIATHNLVIHCAGPFSYRDSTVLKTCIEQGVNYLDVADNPTYVSNALTYQSAAAQAGVTAIVSSGVFPGISNSMVKQGIEQLDQSDQVHLSYIVAGSGGAGITVMRTTFLELQHAFRAWLNGQWQTIAPYSQRQIVEFPAPYGRCAVYWFSTIEAMTLPASFPVKTVITKFGSLPDFYNQLTWMMAHGLPKSWLQHPKAIEFLAQVSYRMTEFTDRFSGIGIAMRAEITGQKQGQPAHYYSTMVHQDTAIAAGCGTGSIAQLMLAGQLHKPGVWPVEQALPTDLFASAMQSRGIKIMQNLQLD